MAKNQHLLNMDSGCFVMNTLFYLYLNIFYEKILILGGSQHKMSDSVLTAFVIILSKGRGEGVIFFLYKYEFIDPY